MPPDYKIELAMAICEYARWGRYKSSHWEVEAGGHPRLVSKFQASLGYMRPGQNQNKTV